jgi:hypothetical protein
MGEKNRPRRATLADELDATRWDFQPGKDKAILLRPVGTVFENVPWEIEPQYLGPAPIAEPEVESDSETDDDDSVDTQPLEPIEK